MLLTTLLSLTAVAAPVPQPIETHLRTTGSWSFSDGSSVYTFADDGGFTLAPNGMSGRTVTGTWTTADWSRFEIDGQWSWVNGLSPAYDFRHLSLHVSVHGSEPDAPVYAVIESLTPQTVRAFAWAGLKTVPATPATRSRSSRPKRDRPRARRTIWPTSTTPADSCGSTSA